uniref:Uncharacterized protein n=1 Tax=Oryza meridionalis TaxID=40149 RepID=A0A0E0C2U9_9ORYZ
MAQIDNDKSWYVPTIAVDLPSCTDQGVGTWVEELGVAIDCLLPNPARALTCRL